MSNSAMKNSTGGACGVADREGGAWCKNGSNFMKFIEAACLLQFRGYSLTKYLSHIFKVDSSKMGRHISIKPILWH